MNIEFQYELEYCCGDEMVTKMVNINAEVDAESEEFDAYNREGDLQTFNKGVFSYSCTSFVATDKDGTELTISGNEAKNIIIYAEDKALLESVGLE